MIKNTFFNSVCRQSLFSKKSECRYYKIVPDKKFTQLDVISLSRYDLSDKDNERKELIRNFPDLKIQKSELKDILLDNRADIINRTIEKFLPLKENYFYFYIDTTKFPSQNKCSNQIKDAITAGHLSAFYTNEKGIITNYLSFSSKPSSEAQASGERKIYTITPWKNETGYFSQKMKLGVYEETLNGYLLKHALSDEFKQDDERKKYQYMHLIGLPIRFFNMKILNDNYTNITKYRKNKYILLEGIVYDEIEGEVYTSNRIKKYNCIDAIYTLFYRKCLVRNPSTQLALYILLVDLFTTIDKINNTQYSDELDLLKTLLIKDVVEYSEKNQLHVELNLDQLTKSNDKLIEQLSNNKNEDLYKFFYSCNIIKDIRGSLTKSEYKLLLKCPLADPDQKNDYTLSSKRDFK